MQYLIQKATKSLLCSGLLIATLGLHPQLMAQQDTSRASNSRELQVEPDFNFTSSKRVKLDISVSDDLDMPLAGVNVSIFAVKHTTTEEDKDAVDKKNLLSSALTDPSGWVMRQIEVPTHVNKLLIRIQHLGMENQRVITLDDSERVVTEF